MLALTDYFQQTSFYLDQVKSQHGAKVGYQALTKGLSKQTVKYTLGKHSYVIKDFAACGEQLKVEQEVQQLLMTAELTAKLYYVDNRILVSEFLTGQLLAETNLNTSEKLDWALQLSAKLHHLPVDNLQQVKRLNPIALITSFELALSNKRATLSEQQQYCLSWCKNQLLPQLAVLPSSNSKLRLCHGDLNFYNLIIGKDNGKGYLIDFESACLAEIEFELAMLIAINLLDEVSAVQLVENYQKHCQSNTELSPIKVTRYLFLSFLINGLWYLLADNQLSQEKQLQLAEQQFWRLEKLIECQK